jgi:ankyrin repeat protein
MSPLNKAIEDLDETAVAALLAAGADVNRPEPELGGCSPLQHAVDIECEDSCVRYDAGELDAAPRPTITRILVAAGADPDLADPRGRTARIWAAERQHVAALHIFGVKQR